MAKKSKTTTKSKTTKSKTTAAKGATLTERDQAMSPEAVSAVTKSRAKAVKGATAAVNAKLAAKSAATQTIEHVGGLLSEKDKAQLAADAASLKTPKTPRAPKPLAPEVVELIALLKTKRGATNEEAAVALKLKSKGKAAHQTPAAQVRGMIRDKVRPLHTVTAEHDVERSGVVYRIVKAGEAA